MIALRELSVLSAPRIGIPWTPIIGVASLAGSFAILCVIWAIAAGLSGRELPGPIAGIAMFWDLVSDPFYNYGPNDKGIGLQLFSSLQRVFTGFALGSLVAIPLGILIGANPLARRLMDPIVQVMRPVSPLAWFPIGLATFQVATSATIFTIFITSLWPTAINTAFGVSNIPETHKNVARVFRFSSMKYVTR